MNKKNLLVLFGGCSPEHEVSMASAAAILSHLRESKYDIIPVYITRDGRWLLYDGSIENIKNVQWEKYGTRAVLSPDRVHRGLLRIVGDKVKTIPVDVAFPALHGANGEDGTVQGLLELAGIPYVGCGVLASALAMDKAFTKKIVDGLGIPQAAYLAYHEYELENRDAALRKIRSRIGYPCFVKPARAGSSVGVAKAKNKQELEAALRAALEVDDKIVIEKAIVGREIECAVLGWGPGAQASAPGEIVPAADFYDYDAKYNSQNSKSIVPAELPEGVAEKIKEASLTIFKAMDGCGLARVDFFVEQNTNKVIFNELNTMPGFTSISMYPMMWAAAGLELEDVLDRLVETAWGE